MAIFDDSLGKVGLELGWSSDLDFVRHTYQAELTPGNGAVSVFACACERYRCISSTAQRLGYLIGLIPNNSLHWRRERRCYLYFEILQASHSDWT